MEWAKIAGIIVVIIIMFLYEWPKIGGQKKREKAAHAVVTIMGGMLAFMLVIYPDMPGPTQWIDALYKPLTKWLGKS